MPAKASTALSAAGILGLILSTLAARTQTAWAAEFAHQNMDADTDLVTYAVASATPAMKRWVGGRDAKVLFANTLDVRTEKFEASVKGDKDDFIYDKSNQLQSRIDGMVAQADRHWNKLATDALVAGTSTLTYDGANFFSASHSQGASGTCKNLVTNSEVAALNVATPAAPTAAEAADIIWGLVNHFRTFKDDQGEPIHEDLNAVAVMVPLNMAAAFQAAATSMIITDGAGSKDNALLKSGIDIRIIPNARLTTTTEIYVFALNGDPVFVMQQKGPVEVSSLTDGSDLEVNHREWLFGIYANRAIALFAWHSALKATLS